MTEKQYQGEFGRWVKDNMEMAKFRFGECAAIELKVLRGKSLGIEEIKDHQLESLDKAAGAGLYYRIADQTIGTHGGEGYGHTLKKPFDCFIMSGVQSWVVVLVYVKGQRHAERKSLVFTTGVMKAAIARAVAEGRKSMRLEMLEEMATKTIIGI